MFSADLLELTPTGVQIAEKWGEPTLAAEEHVASAAVEAQPQVLAGSAVKLESEAIEL